jgi:hypothetical protein
VAVRNANYEFLDGKLSKIGGPMEEMTKSDPMGYGLKGVELIESKKLEGLVKMAREIKDQNQEIKAVYEREHSNSLGEDFEIFQSITDFIYHELRTTSFEGLDEKRLESIQKDIARVVPEEHSIFHEIGEKRHIRDSIVTAFHYIRSTDKEGLYEKVKMLGMEGKDIEQYQAAFDSINNILAEKYKDL